MTQATAHTSPRPHAARAPEAAPLNLHAEGREVWLEFRAMAEEMPGFEALKRSPRFAYLDGIEDGVNIYTYFPFLFAETFPELDRRFLNRLSLMSLLYVHHIVIADSLMDDENDLPPESLLVSNACSLRALEIVTGLFGGRPFPWRQVAELHRQYSLATALEKQRADGAPRSYSQADLLTRLSRKSAMAKLIPLTLCSVSGRDEHLEPLTRSFDLYYLSEQMVDDFRDWKVDLAAGRPSYLLTSVLTACDLSEKVEGLDRGQAAELVGKHIYLSGLAEDYLARAIDYCEQAKEALGGLDCPRWVGFLNAFQMSIHVSRSNIAKRTRQLLLQEDKYYYDLAPASGDGAPRAVPALPHPVRCAAPTVSRAAERAVDFLLQRYKPGTGFEDFMMARGQLTVWVSGYVGVALLGWAGGAGRGRERLAHLRRAVEGMAGAFDESQAAGGWAPSEYAPEDADTTAWVLEFLLESAGAGRRATDEAVSSLVKYRRADGGFSTYLPGVLGGGARGYTGSHPEVTAVAVRVLLKAGLDPDGDVIRRAADYLKECQGPDGLWQSYWWDGQMYATYHCLRALKACGSDFGRLCGAAVAAGVLAAQGGDGSWGEKTAGKNQAFETALALASLLTLGEPSEAAAEALKRGVVWLLNHQAADGGFTSGPMMRVPDKDETEPWKRERWALDSVGGFGALGRDQNRLFTTSTVVSALTDYLCSVGDRRVVVSPRPGRDQFARTRP